MGAAAAPRTSDTTDRITAGAPQVVDRQPSPRRAVLSEVQAPTRDVRAMSARPRPRHMRTTTAALARARETAASTAASARAPLPRAQRCPALACHATPRRVRCARVFAVDVSSAAACALGVVCAAPHRAAHTRDVVFTVVAAHAGGRERAAPTSTASSAKPRPTFDTSPSRPRQVPTSVLSEIRRQVHATYTQVSRAAGG